MEISERLKLVGKMGQKRAQDLLKDRDEWITMIQKNKDKDKISTEMRMNPATKDKQDELDDHSEICVCVRIRPLLDYEVDTGFFSTVEKQSEISAQVFDPKREVRGRPKLNMCQVLASYVLRTRTSNVRKYRIVYYTCVRYTLEEKNYNCISS